MRTIPPDKRREILFPVRVKILIVIAGLLAHVPCIKRLIKYIDPQPVAGLNQGR